MTNQNPEQDRDLLVSSPSIISYKLRHFAFKHLPEHLQRVSQPFYSLAYSLWENLPDNGQRFMALQKLLEARDAALRAAVDDNEG